MKDSKVNTNPEYEVGYRKPPVHTRFKKGERRKRKPKQPESLIAIFKRVCAEKVVLRDGETGTQMTRGQAVLAANNLLASKKNASALRNMLWLAEKHALLLDETDPKQVGSGPVAIPAPPSSKEEWLERVREDDAIRAVQRELEALRAKYGVPKPDVDERAEYLRYLPKNANKRT